MLSYVDIIKIQTKAIEQEKTPSESSSKGMPFLGTVHLSDLVTGFAMGIHLISPVETIT